MKQNQKFNPVGLAMNILACIFECCKTTLRGNKKLNHKGLLVCNCISFIGATFFLIFCPWGLASLGYGSGSVLMHMAEFQGGGVASIDSLSYALGAWLKSIAADTIVGKFFVFCSAEPYWRTIRLLVVVSMSIISLIAILVAVKAVFNMVQEIREIYIDNHYTATLKRFVRHYRQASGIDAFFEGQISCSSVDTEQLDLLKMDFRYERFKNHNAVKELVYELSLVKFLQDYSSKRTSVFEMKADKRFERFAHEELVQNLYNRKARRAASEVAC